MFFSRYYNYTAYLFFIIKYILFSCCFLRSPKAYRVGCDQQYPVFPAIPPPSPITRKRDSRVNVPVC